MIANEAIAKAVAKATRTVIQAMVVATAERPLSIAGTIKRWTYHETAKL